MENGTTLVVFRRWRDSGGIIALFPAEPSDINGWYCLSYERIGQHLSADYHGVSRPRGRRPRRKQRLSLKN